MNIILLTTEEIEAGFLPMEDERSLHVMQVLRRKVGESFDAGLINGPKGKGKVVAFEGSAKTDNKTKPQALFRFEFVANQSSEPGPAVLLPIDLIVGLSRPQTMRKILNEATTLGVRSIYFVATERGEPSYATSKLWTTGEWQRHVVAGVAQAFMTHTPQVNWECSLAQAIDATIATPCRIAMDNYEATVRLGQAVDGANHIILAIGSERGWTGAERNLLRSSGYVLADLGNRVLRTETAVVAALGVLVDRLGRM